MIPAFWFLPLLTGFNPV